MTHPTPTQPATLSKTAAKLLTQLQTHAYLTFSRKAKVTIAAAIELSKANVAVLSAHFNNELKLALKPA